MPMTVSVTSFDGQRATIRLLTVLSLLFLSQNGEAADCLRYEPAAARLTGTIIRKTFPGSPNYESVRLGDRSETVWLLVLPKSICIDRDKDDPDLNVAQKDVGQLQLVFLDPTLYQKYAGLVGKRALATGTLYGAHTGHHHTPVLLTVRSLEQADGADLKP
jgi:hypothetical protein